VTGEKGNGVGKLKVLGLPRRCKLRSLQDLGYP